MQFKLRLLPFAFLAAVAGYSCTDSDSDPPGSPDSSSPTLDASAHDGATDATSSAEASAEDAGTDSSTDATTSDVITDAPIDAPTDANDGGVGAGRVMMASPAQITNDDGSDAIAVSEPNGPLFAIGSTLGGRVLFEEPAADGGPVKQISSMSFDGSNRTVILDASDVPADTNAVAVLAIAPNETIFYSVSRGANFDTWVGSVRSDGTARASLVQVSGGATGITGVAVNGRMPFNDYVLDSRQRGRVNVTDGRLFLSESGPSNLVRVRSYSSDLATITTVLTGAGLNESVCGVLPDGTLVTQQFRTAAFTISDLYVGSTQVTASITTYYNCYVTQSGQVIVRTDDGSNQRDMHIVSGGQLVTLAQTADDETFAAETSTGRIVYLSMDQATGQSSFHVVDPNGANSTVLSAKNDPAGAYGAVLGVTPGGRVLFVRSTTFGGSATLHSVKLDGTDRLDHLAAGKLNGAESMGITSTGRFVYRGLDALNQTRLLSMDTTSVVSAGTPVQVTLSNDAKLQLVLD
jgi:hypothetical protein